MLERRVPETLGFRVSQVPETRVSDNSSTRRNLGFRTMYFEDKGLNANRTGLFSILGKTFADHFILFL